MRPVVVSIALAIGVALAAPAASAQSPDTLAGVVPLPAIEVNTTRVTDRSPVSTSRLDRAASLRANWGQDTPMALSWLPGAYAASDAGNGIGYSSLSVRGFPQRRISVLVNGVPLNDPQSHEVYWIDHPDLLASTAEVQLTRGIGPALYGAAALGGTVSVETSPFSEQPRAAATLAAGSYNTRRVSLEMGSGRLADGWDLYGRYSRIETDGYREQSWSRLWSYALSARRSLERQSFRVNLYGGPEETHLAYLGIPPDYFAGRVTGDADRDRRFNPITFDGEQDHFFEPHYEFVHTWAPTARATVTQTFFWFDGRGYYDEQRFGRELADYRLPAWATSDSTLYPREYYAQDPGGFLARDAQGRVTVERFDVIRRREVINRHYGWVPRARLVHGSGATTIGGELRYQDGRHIGRVLAGSGLPPGTPADAAYYDYDPRVLAAGLFAREEWSAAPQLLVTADLAWRRVGYAMRGDAFDGIRFDQPYDFALPRLGLTWTPRPRLTAFAAYGHASREPAFRDLYDAEGVGSRPLYRVVDIAGGRYEDPLIRPERVRDAELGAAWAGRGVSASVGLYRMDFRDELTYAGQFDTDLGYPILGNAARSVHQGVELAGRAERTLAGGATLALDANASFGDHHFVRYREVYGTTPADEVRFDGKPIGFAPATLANVGGSALWHRVTLGIDAQYAGRIYVDNSGSIANSAGPRTIVNLRGAIERTVAGARVTAGVRVFNVLDTRYATGGYVDYDAGGVLVPFLIPGATRSALAELRVEF